MEGKLNNFIASGSELREFLYFVKVKVVLDSDNNSSIHVPWPCLKIDDGNVENLLRDSYIFQDGTVQQIALDYLCYLSSEPDGTNPGKPMCILIGNHTPFNVRAVFDFSDPEFEPETKRTLFPFTTSNLLRFVLEYGKYDFYVDSLRVVHELFTKTVMKNCNSDMARAEHNSYETNLIDGTVAEIQSNPITLNATERVIDTSLVSKQTVREEKMELVSHANPLKEASEDVHSTKCVANTRKQSTKPTSLAKRALENQYSNNKRHKSMKENAENRELHQSERIDYTETNTSTRPKKQNQFICADLTKDKSLIPPRKIETQGEAESLNKSSKNQNRKNSIHKLISKPCSESIHSIPTNHNQSLSSDVQEDAAISTIYEQPMSTHCYVKSPEESTKGQNGKNTVPETLEKTSCDWLDDELIGSNSCKVSESSADEESSANSVDESFSYVSAIHRTTSRISLSGLIQKCEKKFPVFIGSDKEKLKKCLENLKHSCFSDSPTFNSAPQESNFTASLEKVMNFLDNVVQSKLCSGDSQQTTTGALYVSGIPGVGKTSGVRMCCNAARDQCRVQRIAVPEICIVNAGYLANMKDPMEHILKEIGRLIGLKIINPSLDQVTRRLKRAFVILIIDEIDVLVNDRILSGTTSLSKKEKFLQTILDLTKDRNLKFALIGISNCTNDSKFDRIMKLGSFEEQLLFGSYSEAEIITILQARVGGDLFDAIALKAISKKIADSSGDARQALELAASAVKFRLDTTDDTDNTTGPLVTAKHVALCRLEKKTSIRSRIQGLPLAGKIALCALATLAEINVKSTTIGALRNFTFDCLNHSNMDDNLIGVADFPCLIDTLVDTGLLIANRKNQSNRSRYDISQQQVELGLQLEEVCDVLRKELTQSFYVSIRENAHKWKNHI